MDPAEFRSRFEDLRAGWIDWVSGPNNLTVVSCAVWSPGPGHGENAWLAAAAANRHTAAQTLKAFGVHGLKFNARPSGLAPSSLVEVAIGSLGSVVSFFPDGELVVFRSR